MKKILFIVDDEVTFSKAPPSRFLYIARVFKENNFKVAVIGRERESIMDVEIVEVSGNKFIARLKSIFYAYVRTLVDSYDVLIIRGNLLAFPLLASKVFGKKVICDFHGWLFRELEFYEKTFYNKLKLIFYSFLERIVTRGSDIIISTEGGRNLLGDVDKGKNIVIDNGIDVKEAERVIHEAEKEKEEIYKKLSIPTKKAIIGFLGNWGRWLDMETMFMGAEMAGASMIVVGEGVHFEEYKRKWTNTIFTGRLKRREALKIICLCDAVIIPYKKFRTCRNYFSTRKVKDSLGIGKPIIMAEVTAREAYLVPNTNVLLYEPGNAEDLADKIRKLLSDKKLQKRMNTNNIKLSHRFDWKTLVEESGIIELIKA